jgi:hypothetical protein
VGQLGHVGKCGAGRLQATGDIGQASGALGHEGQEEQAGHLVQVYPSGASGVVGKGHVGPLGQTGPVANGIGSATCGASECA